MHKIGITCRIYILKIFYQQVDNEITNLRKYILLNAFVNFIFGLNPLLSQTVFYRFMTQSLF